MNYYSIIIPVHNEKDYLPSLLNSLKYYSERGHEVIIIDDGSIDGSSSILRDCETINLVSLLKNRGKGYAIKRGLEIVKNNKILIYDGDMEIDPRNISKLMILDETNNIKYVMGHRFESLSPFKSHFEWGNFMFTTFFNILYQTNHKDVLCCAKAFYADTIKDVNLKSNGFDIDTELTCFLTVKNKKSNITQVLIDYKRRSVEEGKKLKVSDGWAILLRIIKMTKFF